MHKTTCSKFHNDISNDNEIYEIKAIVVCCYTKVAGPRGMVKV